MRIGGFQKFSLIDYPGQIAAVLFTQGCLFRCHYCHNSELVIPKQFLTPISFKEILSFLETRKSKLEGVVISGGEPTMQPNLISSIEQIRAKGFSIKLDTSGVMPNVLRELIQKKLIDYIAMDIKAPLERYQEFTNTSIDTHKIEESISIIKSSSLQYEFRTTLINPFHKLEDLISMAKLIQGCRRYVLQKFRPGKTLNPSFQNYQPFTDQELKEFAPSIEPFVQSLAF